MLYKAQKAGKQSMQKDHRNMEEHLQSSAAKFFAINMTSLNFDEQDGILRTISDAPPTHYTIKIQSLSLLSKHSLEKYESGEFEAGGYKWKLVFYPNGNKRRNVTEHISLNLVLAGANGPQTCWEVHAAFRLFLLDQNTGTYFALQEQNERRFHGMKLDWGFDKFLSLKAFTDASNGFVVEDTCVFGAEVLVRKERSTCKGECLSMIKDAIMYKHVWKIDNFSKLNAESYDSQTFIAGDQKWKIKLYPMGRDGAASGHLSLYLALADPTSLPPTSKIYAQYTLRLLNQDYSSSNREYKVSWWFSASSPMQGWPRFITVTWFKTTSHRFLLNDSCTVEAEVTVHGTASALE
ncbi:PREDICTED: MATH [Prunus dulcis]|uniref:PREDICTED: MATH n=2 Tax=Prunus dulcis TaxID=3755 RepID=A0A5E4GC03_PRUDU|nr:PREDICTED: MATH [Prunus dulcis]